MNLTKYIFENIKKYEGKVAIFYQDESMTYQELYNHVLKVAKRIKSLKLHPDEKIILVSDNSFFWVIAYFGIIASGHAVLPLHHQSGKENMKYVYDECKIRYIFAQEKYVKLLKDYGMEATYYTDTGVDGTINLFAIDEKVDEKSITEVNDKEDVAVIIFTSGSTGTPRGVMLTHYNVQYNTNSIIEYLELNDLDRIMVVLPFSYCFGTSLLHTHLRIGAQVVINNRFMFPGKVLEEINEKKCTGFAGVPSTYQILLRKSPLKKMTFPSLRMIQQAGGKLSNELIAELRKALPTTNYILMYGQTEATARLSYLPVDFLEVKYGSIGKGIPGTKLEVLNSNDQPVKPGEVGVIVASGGNIMKGYWNDPKGTTEVLRNGKLYTGDLATVDEDGFIFVVDREKQIIKTGGFRVSPKEVENHVLRLEEVIEVAAIAIPDDTLGEAIKLFVVLTDESKLTEKDIHDYLNKLLPAHKVPKEYEFRSSLPKNTSGKLDVAELTKEERAKRAKK